MLYSKIHMYIWVSIIHHSVIETHAEIHDETGQEKDHGSAVGGN